MKKIVVLFLISCLFIACNDDNDDNKPTGENLQLSISSCKLGRQKEFVEVQILKGAGEYQAISSNSSVAQAIIDNDMVCILGFEIGSATITVMDKDKNKATVKIIIEEFIPRIIPLCRVIFVKKDDVKILSPEYAGKEYRWGVENDGLISLTNTSGNPGIKGNKIGETKISISKDYRVVHYYDVKVVDQYKLILNQSTINWNTGNFSSKMGVIIMMGNGNYTVESSNEAVVTAEIKEYTGEFNDFMCNPATVWLTPKKTGNAIIKVTDQISGQTANVNVNVYIY